MNTPSARLCALGLDLPPVVTPVAAYVPAILDRGVVRTSGQLPMAEGKVMYTGTVGQGGLSPQDATEAARLCALNALAAAAEVAGGVDRLGKVVKVTVFVASQPDFTGQPAVANGASELYGDIFGSAHVRSAVGVAALPLGASVEVEAEFALVDETQ